MTKQTVVYYWTGSTVNSEWYYLEVDYDNKCYSTGKTASHGVFSSNCYMCEVPRYKDINRQAHVLKKVGFTEIETFGGWY